MGRAWYATRERVMRASDVKTSAYLAAEVDAAIESASTAVDKLVARGDDTRPAFAPWTGAITYDWPSETTGQQSSYRLWLAPHALAAAPITVTSAGVDISAACYGSPPDLGAPYSAVEINRSMASVLDPGQAAGQRSAVVTGTWCATPILEDTSAAWQTGGSMTASSTSVQLNMLFGVGSIIRVDSERMLVTDRAWVTSGQTGSLAANTAAQVLTVANGSAFLAGEELLIDAETVRVVGIAGNNLIINRAVGGSVLAAHTSAAIFYSRTATVERAALGTTAAAHNSAVAVSLYRVPRAVEALTVAYAQDQRQQESAAYARTIGSGESERQASGRGIRDLESRVLSMYGRIRSMAV
jgi:hypothetical protein